MYSCFNTKNNFHFYRKSELKKTGGGPAPPELKCWGKRYSSTIKYWYVSWYNYIPISQCCYKIRQDFRLHVYLSKSDKTNVSLKLCFMLYLSFYISRLYPFSQMMSFVELKGALTLSTLLLELSIVSILNLTL